MIRSSLAVAFLAAASVGAHADLYNQNVTNNVIMGTGIANGGFTTDTGSGIELGLRARERYDLASDSPSNVTGSNGNGTYKQNAGAPSANPTRARWNFDWSINTGTANVDAYTYKLGMDFDAGVGTNFQIFDLINSLPYFDHSFGNNSTAQSAGIEAVNAGTYASYKATNNLVQNSWNYDFFDSATFPFLPTADGTYSIFLEAFGANGQSLARADIDVIVGQGAQVPEPGSLALLGLGLTGLVAMRRRKPA